MKLNWGTGIVISFAVFMTAIMIFVIYAMNRDVDLVEENYYDKEINYQQQIDLVNRSNSLNGDIKVSSSEDYIFITYPKEYMQKSIKGELYFYRPSNRYKDFKLALNLDKNGTQYIPSDKISPGMWKLKLSWQMDGADYYKEESILIN